MIVIFDPKGTVVLCAVDYNCSRGMRQIMHSFARLTVSSKLVNEELILESGSVVEELFR